MAEHPIAVLKMQNGTHIVLELLTEDGPFRAWVLLSIAPMHPPQFVEHQVLAPNWTA